MSSTPAKFPKPQLRGLLHQQIKLNFIGMGACVLLAGVYMRFWYGANRKQRYADFYKNYDIDAEFEKMRKKGLFDSCDTN